jgi:hypothetical protein
MRRDFASHVPGRETAPERVRRPSDATHVNAARRIRVPSRPLDGAPDVAKTGTA